jgi:predicted Zn-dependent peptidase
MKILQPRVLAALFAATFTPGVMAYGANAATVRIPDHQRITLPNGLTVILMPRRDVPLIAFTALVRGGARGDPEGKEGIASLVAGLLEKGAGARDAYEFADQVEGAGGSFAASTSAEAITVGGQFLARDRALMIELLADALMRPRLEPAEFEKLRARQIELLKAAKDSDPSELIALYGRAFLFGDHPYGDPAAGSERSLASIAAGEVAAYHRDQFGADRTTLIFAGDVDPAWMRRAVARAFGGWGRARAGLDALEAVSPRAGRRVLLVDSPESVQTYFWIGNVGVARDFPQRAALDVVNTLYGGRFTSILNSELRVRTGLTYGASSSFTRGSAPGEFAIRTFTQTENTEKAVDLALATLERLHREAPGGEMLASGRAYVLGQYPLRLETAVHWAGALAELELYGLDRSYIEGYGPAVQKVDAEAAASVIGRVFPKTDNLVFVLIGDAAKIREVAKKYGEVTEMSLTSPDFTPDG